MSNAKNKKHRSMEPVIEECQAVVLAGGRGTRLRSAFARGPKSMAPVAGRPFLKYLLTWLRSAGIKELIVCVGYKKHQIQKWLGDGSAWGLCVKYSEETTLLGTGGALKRAQKLITSPRCLVINGDSFLDVNLSKLCQFHRRHRALTTIAVARVRNSARYGTVQLDKSGHITAFKEGNKGLPTKDSSVPSGRFQLINGGIYLLEKRFIESIPANRVISLEKEIFPANIVKGLHGFVTRGYFIDIGVPSDFARAQIEFPKRFLA